MSASVSKIPLPKPRRLSPERPSPVTSPQKSVSKLPVKVSKLGNESPVGGHYKENICDYRSPDTNPVRWTEPSPVTSPSRIPVMKSQQHDNADSVTPRIHPTSYVSSQRPQSIDLEDEFVIGKSYINHMSPMPEIMPQQQQQQQQQIRKKSDPKLNFSPQRKISPLAAQVTNSRIPIASDYIKSDRPRASPPRSASSTSLKLSPGKAIFNISLIKVTQ